MYITISFNFHCFFFKYFYFRLLLYVHCLTRFATNDENKTLRCILSYLRYLSVAGLSDLGWKWVRLALNWTKPGLFLIRLCKPKCTENVSDLSNLGPIWPIFSPNMTSLFCCILKKLKLLFTLADNLLMMILLVEFEVCIHHSFLTI